MNSTATRKFGKVCLYSLVAVYFLILVGGVVRSTGSGMGCPDWPTCFGKIVPPTSIDQLPADYKEQYAAYREKKNIKFARYLNVLGMEETARKILEDKSVLVEADFNPAKTWIEYINRLVGAIIGLFIIAVFYRSWNLRKTHPHLFWWSAAALVLVIFQGWFGSIVVSTNLTSWTITVHMFLALLLVANLIWLMVHATPAGLTVPRTTAWLLLASMTVLLIQIFLGTEVRAVLDRLASAMISPRTEWIEKAGMPFIVHRTFSWLVLGVQLALWAALRKTSVEKSLTLIPLLLTLGSLGTGVGMAWFAVPPFLQPLHLLVALAGFGYYYYLYLRQGLKEKAHQ